MNEEMILSSHNDVSQEIPITIIKKKLRGGYSIILSFLFLLNNLTAFTQNNVLDKNIKILQKGVEYYQKKEFLKAENKFLQLTHIDFQNNKVSDTIKFLNSFWLGRTYYELKQFNKAKSYLDPAFLACKNIYSFKDPIYLTCLDILIYIDSELKNIDQSIELLLHKRDILINTDKIFSSDFANNEANLADAYNSIDDFINAEKYYLNSIYTFRKINETESDNYSAILHNLATVYSKLEYFKKASEYSSEAASILKKIRGKDNKEYCYVIINLANVYSQSEQYFKADSLYNESIEMLRKIVGQSHTDYFLALNQYASYCTVTNNYSKADSIYRSNLSMIKQYLGDLNIDYISTLKGLGSLYTTYGRYKDAKIILNQALLISKKLYTENNYRYAQILSSLATIYTAERNNYVADSLFSIVIQIYKSAFGENHTAYAQILGNVADIQMLNGEFLIAEEKIRKELLIYKKVAAKRLYSKRLSSLGYLLIQKKDYKNAEQTLLEANAIQLNNLGIISLDRSITLNVLSELYSRMGKYDDALTAAKEASDIRYKILGDENTMYSGSLNVLSIAYFQIGNYDSAMSTISNAIEITERIQGSDNPNLIRLLMNKSKYYIYLKRNDSALNMLERAINILNKYFNSKFYNLTISEQTKLIYTITPEVENIRSIFYLLNKNKISANGLLYDNQLQFKSIILRNSEELSRVIRKIGSHELIMDLDSLRILRDRIQYSRLKAQIKNTNEYDSLELLAENKEKIILQNLTKYPQFEKSRFNSSWMHIQSKLAQNEAAIEFININNRDDNSSNSIIYGALVLRPSYKEPKFVYLFEQKQIDTLFQNKLSFTDSSFLNKLYQYDYSGKRFQQLIWHPLDSLLINVRTVYLSLSGILYSINISALPLNNIIRVGDKYNLRLVGSTGDIVSFKEQYISDSTINQAWLFGGIDYNHVTLIKPKYSPQNKFIYTYSQNSNTRSVSEKWNYLPNTFYEASYIDSLCKVNNIYTSFISGNLASKNVLKNISGETKPFILHIATHGYFYPDKQNKTNEFNYDPLLTRRDILKMSDNPLLRSGLIFSGANKTWSNPNYLSDSTDDGILTAFEVSNLDFSEARLVIMSACETGLGEIKGSEGVFGLQRAFKLSGAKNIIMSLWKVPDTQTKELMKLFYENCFNGKSVYESFKNARFEMSKKYSPYYWGAFILIE